MCAEVSQQGVILVGRLLLPDAFASCCASYGESSASSIASGELAATTTHVDIWGDRACMALYAYFYSSTLAFAQFMLAARLVQ